MSTFPTQCVIFDIDGVLMESIFFTDCIDPAKGVDISALSRFFSSPGFTSSLLGDADTKQEILPFLDAAWWTDGVDALMDFWMSAEDKPIPEMREYLTELSHRDDIVVAIATNQEQYRTAHLQQSLAGLYDIFISSSIVGARKPEHAFYTSLIATIQEKYTIPIENMIFWDDTQANIDWWNASGLPSFLYTDYRSFRDRIDSFIRNRSS